MKKFKAITLFIIILSIFCVTACEDTIVDTHYKPQEYKHNTSINNALGALNNAEVYVILSSAATDEKQNENIDKYSKQLSEAIVTMKTNQQILNTVDKKELSRSELREWNKQYDSAIKKCEVMIIAIEKERVEIE